MRPVNQINYLLPVLWSQIKNNLYLVPYKYLNTTTFSTSQAVPKSQQVSTFIGHTEVTRIYDYI